MVNVELKDLSEEFATRIIKLCQYLTKRKKELTLSNQLLRCGTDIGANILKADYTQSRSIAVTKLDLALQSAAETRYWIDLLYRTGYLAQDSYTNLASILSSMHRMLVADIQSAQDLM